jgi:Yersinia/Haemophilus virulence surface antigen
VPRSVPPLSIEGLELDVTKRKGGGPLRKFKGLRTRRAVIDHVLNVPGAYIYVVDAAKGGGHAFGFNTINRQDVLFFDPNLGEWHFQQESDDKIREFWDDFWGGNQTYFNGKQSYKDAYHKGGRELWRYSVAERG